MAAYTVEVEASGPYQLHPSAGGATSPEAVVKIPRHLAPPPPPTADWTTTTTVRCPQASAVVCAMVRVQPSQFDFTRLQD